MFLGIFAERIFLRSKKIRRSVCAPPERSGERLFLVEEILDDVHAFARRMFMHLIRIGLGVEDACHGLRVDPLLGEDGLADDELGDGRADIVLLVRADAPERTRASI